MLDLAFIRNHPDIVKEAARVKYSELECQRVAIRVQSFNCPSMIVRLQQAIPE
jgi:hypothetical protein